MKCFDNIWIVEEMSGICLFSYPNDDEYADDQIVSGFFSVIQIIAGKITELKFENRVVLITHDEETGLTFIARTKKKHQKWAKKQMKKISVQFKDKFKDKIKTWNNNTGTFNEFIPMINKLINTKNE